MAYLFFFFCQCYYIHLVNLVRSWVSFGFCCYSYPSASSLKLYSKVLHVRWGLVCQCFLFNVSPSTLGFPLSLWEGLSSYSFLLWQYSCGIQYLTSILAKQLPTSHLTMQTPVLNEFHDWLPYNPSFLMVSVEVIIFQIVKLFCSKRKCFPLAF